MDAAGGEGGPKKLPTALYLREFWNIDTSLLIAYLKTCEEPFRAGGVFLTETQQNIVDPDTRTCLLRSMRDPKLFAACGEILAALTANDPLNFFKHFENDVTQIVYSPGGKFEQHRDYLSLASNVVEEYTLVVNVNEPGCAEIVGGETLIKVNAATQLVSKASTTPGGALLFRKDLQHQSLQVTQGQKEVISINVWCMRKATASEQIVLVTFPGSGGQDVTTDDAASYALSVSCIERHEQQSMLSAFVRFENSKGGPRKPVLVFEAPREFSAESFRPVFQILTGGYSTVPELMEHSAALIYFGVRVEDILVSLADAGNAETEEDVLRALGKLDLLQSARQLSDPPAGLGLCPLTDLIEDAPQAMQEDDEGGAVGGNEISGQAEYDDNDYEFDEDDEVGPLYIPDPNCDGYSRVGAPLVKFQIQALTERREDGLRLPLEKTRLSSENVVVCTSSDKTAALSAYVREHELPFVRFRVIFAEGAIGEGYYGHFTPAGLLMQPVFVAIGDYDNIFALRRLTAEKNTNDATQNPAFQDFSLLNAIRQSSQEAVNDDDAAMTSGGAAKKTDIASNLLLLPQVLRTPEEKVSFWFEDDDEIHSDNSINLNSGPYICLSLVVSLTSDDGQIALSSTVASVLDHVVAQVGGSQIEQSTSLDTVVLPGGASVSSSLNKVSTMFHFDEAGKSCFSLEEAQLATQRLIDINFVDALQARIRETSFHFTQLKHEDCSTYNCNEAFYSNLKFVEMTGLVKLD